MNTAVKTQHPGSSSRRNVAHTMPCVHCGLPTPSAADADPERVFCCNGCRGAYDLINGWGLTDFYALRDQMSHLDTALAANDRGGFEAFDNVEFLGKSKLLPSGDTSLSVDLTLHGLHCGACAWLIENAANQTNGWQLARVRMSDHTIRIVFDPQATKLSEIARLLARLGYEVAPLTEIIGDSFRRENRKLITQIAIAGFCAANAMWIAIALYAGAASGVAADHRIFLRIVGTTLGFAAVAGPGRTFFRGAIASLKTRTPHMDLPVALGLSVGTTAGIWNAIFGEGAVYFDSLAVLVFLLLIGRWIQFRQQHRAARAVDLLMRISPRHAHRLNDAGDTDLVLSDSLVAGDVVRIAAGDSVPVDGVIEKGESTIDRSLLTGESKPIHVVAGEKVFAGTTNMTRPIDVRVQAVGSASRVGQVMKSVEAASVDKTPIVHLADRIGGVFVVVVTLLALATFIAWVGQGWHLAAETATSLLIVACPCALALATPLAIAVSLGHAARRKILIRDGTSMQLLSQPGTIWFDKTGTLTEGRPRVVALFGDENALRHAAAIERECSHPLAEGILRDAAERGLAIPEDAQLTKLHVGGISGESAGHKVDIGNARFMSSRGIDVSTTMHKAFDRCLEESASPIMIAIDGQAVTVVGMADPLRNDARSMIRNLEYAGWQVGILSGDNNQIVNGVAKELGIAEDHAFGERSPEEKLSTVTDSRVEECIVVMVGDGANDAAALAAADVGIAVRGGAEVSLQAAPVYIASGKLASIGELMSAARSTRRLIYTTFVVSLLYNAIAVALAASGQISPLVAAVLMPISSVSVLAITLSWRVFAKEKA